MLLRTGNHLWMMDGNEDSGNCAALDHPSDGPVDQISADIDGNRLSVIETGPDLLAALIALIDGAQSSLRLYYYIFAADRSGQMVVDALLAALGRDVQVTLIIDAFGSSTTPDGMFNAYRAAGGRVARFGGRRSMQYLIRNHQKMAIADRARILIGGFNVEDAYFGIPSDNCWHDVGLLLDGPATAPMVRWFGLLEAWVFTGERRFTMLRAMVRRWRPGDGPLRWMVGGPARFLSPWARAVKHDLETGTSLDMVEAYFSPSRGMLRRIGRVARRGSARLVMASKSDNSMTIAAARFLYGGLLRRRVKIYEYQPCRLHMKLIVVDDAVYIGSANFDMRSLFLNLEIMLRVEDAGFAEAMRGFVARRIDSSLHITAASHRAGRNPFRLIKWWIGYMLVGVLDYTVTRRLNFRA